jgi:hypothetical protein
MNNGFTPSTHAVNRGQDICLVLIVPNTGYLLTKFTQRSWRWLKSPIMSHTFSIGLRSWLLAGHCIETIPTSSKYSDIILTMYCLEYEIIPDKWSKWYHILFQDICYINCATHCPSGKNMQIGTSRRTYTVLEADFKLTCNLYCHGNGTKLQVCERWRILVINV